MNKLTKRQYVMLVADALNRAYGDSLVEWDTDIELAEAVVEELREYLYFSEPLRGDYAEFQKWKKARIEQV